jgi:hypothetical protein
VAAPGQDNYYVPRLSADEIVECIDLCAGNGDRELLLLYQPHRDSRKSQPPAEPHVSLRRAPPVLSLLSVRQEGGRVRRTRCICDMGDEVISLELTQKEAAWLWHAVAAEGRKGSPGAFAQVIDVATPLPAKRASAAPYNNELAKSVREKIDAAFRASGMTPPEQA